MESFSYAFNVVAPIFLIVAIGAFIRHIGIIDNHWLDVTNRFGFYVCFPCILFDSIYTSNINLQDNISLVLFVFFGIILAMLFFSVVYPLFFKDRGRVGALVQASVRSNFLLMGMPIAVNMFGAENIAPVAMMMAVTVPTYNVFSTIVLIYFSGSKEHKISPAGMALSIIKNPLIITAALGGIFSAFSIPVPGLIYKAVSDLSSIATPTALIMLGGMLSFESLRRDVKPLFTANLVKLVLLPAVMVTLGYLMGFRGMEIGAIFIVFATPSAVSCYTMAQGFGCDGELSGEIVLSTTFFCLFTTFIGVFLLRQLGLV